MDMHMQSWPQEKFCKAEQDSFGTRWQAEISLKIDDLRSNKTSGKL